MTELHFAGKKQDLVQAFCNHNFPTKKIELFSTKEKKKSPKISIFNRPFSFL